MNQHFPSQVWQYCPWCGAKTFRASAENCMECSSCNKKFFINAASAVACIIENKQNDILLTRRAFDPAKGMLDLPGGFVNLDETAEDAVKREVMEELNLTVKSMIFIGTAPNQYLYGGITYNTLDIGFFCTVDDFTVLKAKDDVSGYEFVPRYHLDLKRIGFKSTRSILKQYLDLLGKVSADYDAVPGR